MPADLAVIRHELLLLVRQSRRRVIGAGYPYDWRPHEVVNPEDPDGQVFTEVGAWEFMATVLERGHPLEEIELDNPRGRKAYVMTVDMGLRRPRLYIKLQLGAGTVIARSFHNSDPKGEGG